MLIRAEKTNDRDAVYNAVRNYAFGSSLLRLLGDRRGLLEVVLNTSILRIWIATSDGSIPRFAPPRPRCGGCRRWMKVYLP